MNEYNACIYTLVIESPRGEIHNDCLTIKNEIEKKWQFAQRYVKLVYGKSFHLCDMYVHRYTNS